MDSATTSLRFRETTSKADERQSPKLGRRARAGVTLIELMLVVTIVIILGAIATPLYSKYLYRARASEAPGVMFEIWNQQKSWRKLQYGQSYDNVSANGSDWYPNSPPSDIPAPWTNNAAWTNLLGQPYPAQHPLVYFRYLTVAGVAGSDPSAALNNVRSFPAGATHNIWFITRAIGDLDNDGTKITFEVSSENFAVRSMGTADEWE